MGVSGLMFLLVPAYPGCPGQTAVKWLLLLLLLLLLPISITFRYLDHLVANGMAPSMCPDHIIASHQLNSALLYRMYTVGVAR